MPDRVLIKLDDVVFGYDGGRAVLRSCSLELREGEKLGLVGHIGSGKTTLLHLVVGLLRPQGGKVVVFGRERAEERDFWEVREKVGLLFQDPEDQLFCPTVLEETVFGPLNQGKKRDEALAITRETLCALGLEGYETRITHHLSGGEKRLVSLAAVLAMRPEVLLLDEPVSGLDPEAAEKIKSLLRSLPQAMIIVSHDIDFLRSVTTRCMLINGGSLSSG